MIYVQEAVNASEGVACAVWVELIPQHYFADYALEGVTPEDNQILMEVNSESMAKTLGILKSSGSSAPKSLKVLHSSQYVLVVVNCDQNIIS